MCIRDRTYEIHGPDILTGEGTAGIYSKHLNREVRYSGDDLNAWAEKSKGMMPEFLIADMRIMYSFFQEHGLPGAKNVRDEAEKLLGRKPRTFDDFVKETVLEWRTKVPKAA